MIALAPWQGLLNALGWVVAQIYDFIPNYGVTIILLTVTIRLILLPLGIKQVRSMQHMQIVQPKIKQIQAKYKGNKTRQQEEIMKLYKEYGVNPFSGCWPVLLQFPILIAMYSVLRWPQHPIHVPTDSGLYAAVSQQIPETLPPGDPNGDADHDAGADQRPGPAGSDLGHLVPGDEPAVLGRARGQPGRHARRQERDRAEPRRTPSTAGARSWTGSPTTCSRR